MRTTGRIKRKKNKKGNGWCVPRGVCLRPKLDDAVVNYCEENEKGFSELMAGLLRDFLISAGYYKKI